MTRRLSYTAHWRPCGRTVVARPVGCPGSVCGSGEGGQDPVSRRG
jgi:hypothetical protein